MKKVHNSINVELVLGWLARKEREKASGAGKTLEQYSIWICPN